MHWIQGWHSDPAVPCCGLDPAMACKHPQCRSHLLLYVHRGRYTTAARDINAYVRFHVFTLKLDCLIQYFVVIYMHLHSS